jgi:Tol biopolymer transport system component
LVNLGSVAVVDEFYIKWPTRARWSPDGTRLAYIEDTTVHEDPDDPSRRIWPNPRFFILDTMTMKKQDYGVGVTEDFSWTPDGEHIIHSMKYAHPTLGVYTLGIFIMRVSDGNEIGRLSNVSATPGDSGTITPSGQYVYWQALNTDTFFVVKNPFFHEMNYNLE